MKGWPLYIVIFFVIVFIADGFLIYSALSNPDEIVASYRQNQDR